MSLPTFPQNEILEPILSKVSLFLAPYLECALSINKPTKFFIVGIVCKETGAASVGNLNTINRGNQTN